jgi:hypothetical protein
MPDTATGIAASGQPQLSVSREGMAVVDGSSVRIILGKLPNGDYGIWIADASGNVLIDGSHIILTQASGQIPIGVTFGLPETEVTANGIEVTDGTRMRATLGNLGTDYGIKIVDASGNALIDGSKIQLAQSTGTVPSGVVLGNSSTTITANGVQVSDGTRARATLGHIGTDYGIKIVDASGNVLIDGAKIILNQSTGTVPSGVVLGHTSTTVSASGIQVSDGTLVRAILGLLPDASYGIGLYDAYGGTLLEPQGFGSSWAALVQSGILNNMFVQATPGALTLGTSRTDATGETAALPFWTVWKTTGSGTATVVADATWPGGNYVKFAFSAVGTATTNNVAITSDLFPVQALDQWNTNNIHASNVPGGVTLNGIVAILWYTASGVYISTSSDVPSGGSDAKANFGGSPFIAPVNARYARVEFNAWETVLHNALTSFSLGSVGLIHTGNGNVGTVYDITAGGSIASGGAAVPTTNDIVSGNEFVDGGGAGGATGGVYIQDTTGAAGHGLQFGPYALPDISVYRSAPGVLTLSGGTTYTGTIYPTQIVANTDNYNPTGLAGCHAIIVNSSAAYNLTGIVAQADGREYQLINNGAFTITLKHNATSTAANRFYCPGSVDYALTVNNTALLRYDANSSRWRVK